jgi:hypothetical protein
VWIFSLSIPFFSLCNRFTLFVSVLRLAATINNLYLYMYTGKWETKRKCKQTQDLPFRGIFWQLGLHYMTNVMILTLQSSNFLFCVVHVIYHFHLIWCVYLPVDSIRKGMFSVWELFKMGPITNNKSWYCMQVYNESRLKSSFRKFYGCYNDLVCDYKLSLAHMLNDLFHTICSTVVSILALTTGNPVYLISTKAHGRCDRQQRMLTPPWHLILPSYLWGFVLPYTRFCTMYVLFGLLLRIFFPLEPHLISFNCQNPPCILRTGPIYNHIDYKRRLSECTVWICYASCNWSTLISAMRKLKKSILSCWNKF